MCGPVPCSCRFAETSTRVITPIVFCASFVPCDSATSEEEKICPYLKGARRAVLPSSLRRVIA